MAWDASPHPAYVAVQVVFSLVSFVFMAFFAVQCWQEHWCVSCRVRMRMRSRTQIPDKSGRLLAFLRPTGLAVATMECLYWWDPGASYRTYPFWLTSLLLNSTSGLIMVQAFFAGEPSLYVRALCPYRIVTFAVWSIEYVLRKAMGVPDS